MVLLVFRIIATILIWNGSVAMMLIISDSTSPSYWDDSGYTQLNVPPVYNCGTRVFYNSFRRFHLDGWFVI